ncbi:hypothetical protein BT63DRAFT_418168 [Microthyrium microscopicum]|uniref:DNA repair protein RAD50 n=1 Tax=Microthyrium microscopicum TaxID=703497 RepID=A0A6A6TVC3_9PEZI|nr:hypothetical protein BT63DRAFT_418168 [Microthyrium microscopicum]
MSKINRLLISGIRSFDPHASEVIKIYTPLTLIVGPNGSGKTTIIECLRYITTGELPPNSATGGAWLHDPKLVGENEVLGHIKMSFTGTAGEYMICDRKLQLTVKKASRSQKALEGVLKIIKKNGEETVVSSKRLELDEIMPKHLGVSKVILESVIFCHQDDSLWPMSASSVLKTKFDAIFEASKYTKAVNELKLSRKDLHDQLGVLKLALEHAEKTKVKRAVAEEKMQKLYDVLESLREQHAKITEDLKVANAKATEAWDHAAGFERILSDLNSKRVVASTLKDSLETSGMSITKMSESDEELLKMQAEYGAYVAKLQNEKDALSRRWEEVNSSMKKSRQALGNKQTEVGMFKNAMNQYERQVQTRKALVKEIAAVYSIRGFDNEISDDLVDDFKQRLDRLLRDEKSAADHAREEHQSELSKAQSSLSGLTGKRTSLTHSQGVAKARRDANESKISDLQRQVNLMDVDEGRKAVLETRVQDLSERHQRSKAEFEKADWTHQVENAESTLSSLSEKKDRLDAEQVEAARHAADLGQLDYLVQELKSRRKLLDTNTKSYDKQFRSLLQGDWSPQTVEQKYKQVMEDYNDAVKSAEVHRDRLQRDLEQENYKLREATRSLETKRKQSADSYSAIKAVTDEEPADYEKTLAELEDSYEIGKSDQTMFQVLDDYYTKCEEVGGKKNLCQLCQRSFSSPTEKKTFLTRVEKLRKDRLAAMNDDVQRSIEEDTLKFRAIRHTYDTWIQVTAEIPDHQKLQSELECNRDKLNLELEKADETVKERSTAKRDAEQLNKPIQSITKCLSEISTFESQLHDLEAKQNAMGKIRSTTAIQDEIKLVNGEIKSATAEVNRIRTERERCQHLIFALYGELSDASAKYTQIQHDLAKKLSLETQITENQAQSAQEKEYLKRMEQDLQVLAPEIAQMQEKLNDIADRGNGREREAQASISKVKDSISRLALQSHEIDDFISRGGPLDLARGTREMESLEADIKKLEAEAHSVGKEVNKADKELRNHDDRKQSIAQNLTYRANQKKLADVELAIAQAESTNAERDRAHYNEEGETWQRERNRLSAEQATISGEVGSKDDQLTDLNKEYLLEYKDAIVVYQRCFITLKVTESAISDLDKYAKALDKAILKYHSAKMDEINRIIEELWRKTYRGSDVDTIFIRSDPDSGKAKSYNYRVVMVKQDAEMDMRGRCSAGQKVLASIIIRLALAECFSTKCGVIALDEPTTNLDRDNIRSLGQSLNELIRYRRKQANFQLIVITHDEEFLRQMKCADLCDEYFRISRSDKQKSSITKQSISEVYR